MAFPALLSSPSIAASVQGEYALSGPLNGDQTAPRVALGNLGGWAVWQDNGIDGSGFGIGARRIEASLATAGPVFRINATTAGDQEKPDVAALASGGAVVAWQSGRQGFQNIFARFLNADGTFATGDILVNPPARSRNSRVTTNWMVIRNNRVKYRTQRIKQIIDDQHERGGGAVVATLANGTVVVAYSSARRIREKIQMPVPKIRFIHNRFITNSVLQFVESSSDSMQDVYFQLFSRTGEKTGPEVRANQAVDSNQRHPQVAALNDGTFVLVWISDEQRGTGAMDAIVRRFDSQGAPVGDEFLANAEMRPCGTPAVTGHVEGGFTVTWSQKSTVRAESLEIYARTYGPSATPITTAFRVNTHAYGDQFSPAIAAAPGSQMIVWTSLAQDGSREGVFARLLNNGSFSGPEFRVNTTTHLRQFHPGIAADSTGRFLTVWSSYQTTAGFDVFSQQYVVP